jgi:hypothetical protein
MSDLTDTMLTALLAYRARRCGLAVGAADPSAG